MSSKINIYSVIQTNILTKEVTKELISRKILERDHVLSYFSTLWGLEYDDINEELISRKFFCKNR